MNQTKIIPAHNVFNLEDDITFSSNFDNGNLSKVERLNSGKSGTKFYKIWTAPDNLDTEVQSKHCAWFHFMVSGIPSGTIIKIQIANAANHGGLYKHDMRPVFKSNTTNQKWTRIRNSVRFIKSDENSSDPKLTFEHAVEISNDKLFFAFTYPYTYSMVQQDLNEWEKLPHINNITIPGNIYYHRELLTTTCDGLRMDLVTISSVDDISDKREELISGLFPDGTKTSRCFNFKNKEIIFVSARVHPGEVPAQHTLKGIFNLLMDNNDLRAKELRKRYVFKIIPILNPDGVYRGHFRMDQFGQNLNRYYVNPSPEFQPTILAAKTLLNLYANEGTLALYLDLHAHASKRGCFIYGNVLDEIDHQVQNQLYCKLIAMNSAHFDYEGCLFSREHMSRVDPGDQDKGLTAEGSGRVATYISHGLIHSYTLECNYNTSKTGNEIAACDVDPQAKDVQGASHYTTNPETYNPSIFNGVGSACLVALLDIRDCNPCSRIRNSKIKTLEKVRFLVKNDVKQKKEFKNKEKGRPSALKKNQAESNNKWHRTVNDSDDNTVLESIKSTSQSKKNSSSSSNYNQLLLKKDKEVSNCINKIQTKSFNNKQIDYNDNVQQKNQNNSNNTRESSSAGSVPTSLRRQYKNITNSEINQLKEINVVKIDDNNLDNIGKIIINENDKLKNEEKYSINVKNCYKKEMKQNKPVKQIINGSPTNKMIEGTIEKLIMAPTIDFNHELILPSRNIDFISDSILDKRSSNQSKLSNSLLSKSRIPRRSSGLNNFISEGENNLNVPLLSGLMHTKKISINSTIIPNSPIVNEKKLYSKSNNINDTLSNLLSEEF